jgi:hypothetical protein
MYTIALYLSVLIKIVLAVPPAFDPNFPKLGIANLDKPTHGRWTLLTGITIPRGQRQSGGYITRNTLRECIDYYDIRAPNMLVWY